MGFDHTLDAFEKKELLRIARSTLTEYLFSKQIPPGKPHRKTLTEGAGAFVTLKTAEGRLRGCIGTFSDETPLYRAVQEMAVAAATNDPRFPPVTEDELEHLRLEISVLSSLKPATPEEVVVGTHGLYVTRGFNRGVLLPQVPVELGWDRETFLKEVCVKAGLPPETYRESGTKLETFTAQVFGEGGEGQGAED